MGLQHYRPAKRRRMLTATLWLPLGALRSQRRPVPVLLAHPRTPPSRTFICCRISLCRLAATPFRAPLLPPPLAYFLVLVPGGYGGLARPGLSHSLAWPSLLWAVPPKDMPAPGGVPAASLAAGSFPFPSFLCRGSPSAPASRFLCLHSPFLFPSHTFANYFLSSSSFFSSFWCRSSCFPSVALFISDKRPRLRRNASSSPEHRGPSAFFPLADDKQTRSLAIHHRNCRLFDIFAIHRLSRRSLPTHSLSLARPHRVSIARSLDPRMISPA